MKLTGDIRAALTTAQTDGNLLRLVGQLDPKTYKQVDAALQSAGGRWVKGRKAHVFAGPARDAVERLTAQDEVTTAAERQQATQFFQTPAIVVDQLISAALLHPETGRQSLTVLEPSAGKGAIAAVVAPLVDAVDCVELDEDYAAKIRAGGYARKLTVRDFLTVTPEPIYDRVIMNPPFTRGADITHVTHALRFVKPGGRLVSVMSAGVKGAAGKAAAKFRAMVEGSGWFTDLPAGAFEESGTPIRTVIVIINVPGGTEDAGPAGAEPVRVTFDNTATSAPRFNPRTAKPGVYVAYDSWGWGRDRVFRFRGKCIGCGVPTWRHDDGDDDVRGAFGDNTGMPLDAEDLACLDGVEVPEGTTFPRCALCWNEYERYELVMKRARALLTAKSPLPASVPVLTATASEREQLALFAS